MDPITTSIASGATVAAIKLGLDAAFAKAAAAGSKKVKSNLARRAVLRASVRIDHVRKVKTILHRERAVDLFDFYFRSRVRLGTAASVLLSSLNSLPTDDSLLILGTVGQGKSMLLRYLTVVEAVDGDRIPLFIELRRLGESELLITHLAEELQVLGIRADADVFASLADSGSLILMLDAYDEVSESRRIRLAHELEMISRKFPRLRMVMTSRPGTDVDSASIWVVCELAELAPGEYQGLVRRLCPDRDTAEQIIKGVQEANSIEVLLTTPLMVSLLVVRYETEDSIPENLLAFFKDLFMLLLQRHDKSKGGFVRQRKSGLGDVVLERAFMALCFLARKTGNTVFSGQVMYMLTVDALKEVVIDARADAVLDDIVSITCLVMRDGTEYRFVHKLILEYHAACFVEHQTEAVATAFYRAIATRWAQWQEELRFLALIDEYRFLKYFVLEAYSASFPDDDQVARQYLRNMLSLKASPANKGTEEENWDGIAYSVGIKYDLEAAGWFFTVGGPLSPLRLAGLGRLDALFRCTRETKRLTLEEILALGGDPDVIAEYVDQVLSNARRCGREAAERVKAFENREHLMNF